MLAFFHPVVTRVLHLDLYRGQTLFPFLLTIWTLHVTKIPPLLYGQRPYPPRDTAFVSLSQRTKSPSRGHPSSLAGTNRKQQQITTSLLLPPSRSVVRAQNFGENQTLSTKFKIVLALSILTLLAVPFLSQASTLALLSVSSLQIR